VRGQSARKRIFLKTFAQNSGIKIKINHQRTVRPKDGLSAQYLKTVFPYDFQRILFTKRNRHSSKCNACKFLIQVALWKVKPMKLIPLDSTAIYPINPVI
jgi:hypothetical protein